MRWPRTRAGKAATAFERFDAAGNVTARGSDIFTYDQANRLKSATVTGESGTQTGTYVYNGDGNRASKTVGTTTTNYAYDVNASLPNVLTDGTLKYVYGLDLAYAVDSAGNVQVYHTDGLGSVRAITDIHGTLIQTYQTDEFGNPSQPPSSNSQPFQYTGQQSDAESGLYYLRARMYDSGTGRFLSGDPIRGSIGQPQSLNPYAYAGNNPVAIVDPTGLTGDCDNQESAPGCKGFAGATAGGGGGLRSSAESTASAGPVEEWVQGVLPLDDAIAIPETTSEEATAAAESAVAPSVRNLRALAYEIRTSGLNWRSRELRTIAVGEDKKGRLWAGSSNGFDAGQQAALDRLDIQKVVSHPNHHAEEELLREVEDLQRVGTSRRLPCGPAEHNCLQQLIDRGVQIQQ